ncbi:DNA polymerase subunit gamma-2 isoform X2 [Dendropsophus ebraccatus]|uniref:DNA polymerase subunit gamma-2 isoform X2 n=1 Tax=Dendropsophus ebraccatus TaxID=150705 RepID=UPI003831E526
MTGLTMSSFVIRACWSRSTRFWLERYRGLPCLGFRLYTGVSSDRIQDVLLDLCQRRRFILGEELTAASVLGGCHSLGPLGSEMKKNIINEWWNMVGLSREQVLHIDTSQRRSPSQPLSKDEQHGLLRQDLLHGALSHYIACLELVNRKLPFGIAEVGKCFYTVPDLPDGVPRTGERTMASLCWFSSAKTSSQWRDYWLRHRLLWWRRFAQVPSGFNSSDHQDTEGGKTLVINYDFPWGREAVETLRTLDDSALSQMHAGATAKLHVLRIHPSLAPIKVAVDLGKGPAVDLRLVCQGLSSELRGSGISVWPGYLDTMQTPMEQLFTKYDEMGVMFTVLVSDVTLESGLLHLRNRDTTIKETVHISKLRAFLTQYMSAASKL